MRAERISVMPFEELEVEDYEGMQEMNEHTVVKIKGQIPFGKKDQYAQMCQQSNWVYVYTFFENIQHVLFCGVVVEGMIKVVGNTCSMEITLQSGTVLMDQKKKIRSFQEKKHAYDKVFAICNQGYENIAVSFSDGKTWETEQFIMQYMETDWEFIKRVASLNYLAVFPECQTAGIGYSLGIPEAEEITSNNRIEYRILCDTEEYQKKAKERMNITFADTFSYIWESREIYTLGCWCIINGQQYYIWKIETRMKGNELFHTYFARTKNGLLQSVKYNANLSGASLFGFVSDVKNERIQIKLIDDENKDQSEARWFLYATNYSSPDGGGWYCMPEIGDKVRLYFPDSRDQEAYAVSAFHEQGATLRQNPKLKFWRNKEGKEIQLAPGKVLLTNNNGTYVELSDTDGVNIVSAGSVTLSAGGALRISSANSSIELSAPNKVKIKQGDTEMNLGGDLNMSGAQIKL